MKKMRLKNVVQFLQYNAGGLLYFWSAWTIITYFSDELSLVGAYILGNGIGLGLNYVVQKFVAFRKSEASAKKSGRKFAVLTVLNLAIGYVLLKVLVEFGVSVGIAQFGNALFFTIWNWILYKNWVFKK